eukprot:250391-Amphidinium_carterae.1
MDFCSLSALPLLLTVSEYGILVLSDLDWKSLPGSTLAALLKVARRCLISHVVEGRREFGVFEESEVWQIERKRLWSICKLKSYLCSILRLGCA